MKCCKLILTCLCVLVLMAGVAGAKTLDEYINEIQKDLSKNNIKTMLDVTRLLKESGVSFQDSLLAPPALADQLEPGESLKVMIGIYQFDALYAAAFGKKKLARDGLEAQSKLAEQMNFKGMLDISTIFPPAVNGMLRDPEKMDIKRAIRAYADSAEKYHMIMREPVGFDVIEGVLYGFVLEGLYVLSQTVAMQADAAEANSLLQRKISLPDQKGQETTLLQRLEKGIDLIVGLYSAFSEQPAHYAQYVDPDMPEEMVERAEWFEDVRRVIDRLKTKASEADIMEFSEMIAVKRNEIVENN